MGWSRGFGFGFTVTALAASAAWGGISITPSPSPNPYREVQVFGQDNGQDHPVEFANDIRVAPAFGPFQRAVQGVGPGASSLVMLEADQNSSMSLTRSGQLLISGTWHAQSLSSFPGRATRAGLNTFALSDFSVTFQSDVAFSYRLMARVSGTGVPSNGSSLLTIAPLTAPAEDIVRLDSQTPGPRTLDQGGTLPPGTYRLAGEGRSSVEEPRFNEGQLSLQFVAGSSAVPLPDAWAASLFLAAIAAPVLLARRLVQFRR